MWFRGQFQGSIICFSEGFSKALNKKNTSKHTALHCCRLLLHTKYSENTATGVVVFHQVLLGKTPPYSSAISDCKWRGRCTGWSRCCFQMIFQILWQDAGFKILKKVSSVGYFIFLERSSVEQALADTQSYAVATDTSPKWTHTGCEKMLVSQLWRKKKKKKSSKGTNKENLTQSPINGIGSIYLSMIKCYHCTLIAKFDDDRHPRK